MMEKGGWQHAVDDALVNFGRTSEEFATPHEAVAWLLDQQTELVKTLLAEESEKDRKDKGAGE